MMGMAGFPGENLSAVGMCTSLRAPASAVHAVATRAVVLNAGHHMLTP
jgi:hypothetical protein